MAVPRTIGNRLAPPRFILFFVLLFAGIGIAVAYLPRAKAVMIGFDLAAAVFLLNCLPLFRHEAERCAGPRARMMPTERCCWS